MVSLPHRSDNTLRTRMEAEFREIPGLSVTVEQARRLWAMDHNDCRQALDELMAAGLLRCTTDGSYRRHTGEDVCAWRRREA